MRKQARKNCVARRQTAGDVVDGTMLQNIYQHWHADWQNVPRGFELLRQEVVPLCRIRSYPYREDRVYFLWCRLVYVTYRVRKLRRTLAHGFAYLSRWKDLKWANTKRPAARRGGANALVGAATSVDGDTNTDLEAADPELNPADVIDAAGGKVAGKLVQAWCTITSLCLSTIAAQTLPAVYFLYDLSPITMEVSDAPTSLGHFLTRVCAVVGGVFAVTGMTDRWIHRAVNLMNKVD